MFAVNLFRKFIITLIALTGFVFSGKSQLAANFSANPLTGCSPQIVSFNDLSTGNPVQWQWDLGNGTTSYIQNPSATYFTPGQYDITLIVQDILGNLDTLTRTHYVTVFPIPVVNFSASSNAGCVPFAVNFTDMSSSGTSAITSWLWDFGDGTTSTVQNPSHTYTSVGNFNVTLIVTNASGCRKTLTKTNFIQGNGAINANFTNTTAANCTLPVTITFTNTSTGPGITGYLWDFGDGNFSTLQNPIHSYFTGGNYTVKLTVTTNAGCTSTITKTNSVVINISKASFNYNSNACVNTPTTFTNTSVPAPASVLWRFGDGTTSTALSPSKTYTTPGTYQVTLIAYLGNCADSIRRTITINPKPTVGFSAVNLTSCKVPYTVDFTNSSTGGVTYKWSFGDGNTSTQQDPTHTYTSFGQFNVKLVVTNINGCSDSLVKNSYIKIARPIVTINNLPRKGCGPITWTFNSSVTSPDPVVSYFWDFGDGTTSALQNPTKTFTAVGSYNIKIVVTTSGGCKDSTTVMGGIVIDAKPKANFVANPRDVCAKDDVYFTDLSTGNTTHWLWNFGDGSTSTLQNPSHHYNDTGYFHVQLIVWNNSCADTIKFLNYVHILPPIAAFSKNFVCGTPKTIIFTDYSIGPDTWTWDFGDGTTSIQQHNTHTYANLGTYIVKLIVYNTVTGCSDETSQPVTIINEKANFIATDTIICRNQQTVFNAIGNIPGNVASYQWNFGDGSTGSGASVAHVYTLAGSYTVRLNITDIAGCRDSLVRVLYIRVNGPTSAFSIPVPGSCLNSTIVFNDASTNDGTHPIIKWMWNYGDGIRDTLMAPPFRHTYNTSGSFNVSLKTVDSNGCTDSTLNPITIIISRPVAGYNLSDTIACPGIDVTFNNTSTGPALTYSWDFGDGTTSSIANPLHNYLIENLYTIKLRITDQYGCIDSISKNVRIASPKASFTISDSVSTCPPLIASFTNTTQYGFGATWDFGDGSTSSAANPMHIYNNPGTFIAKLFVAGAGNNCFDTVYKVITISGPSGTFTYNPILGCSPLTVSFTANATNNHSFIWDFNDGSIRNTLDSNVSYTYTLPGNYLPKMILEDQAGCRVPVIGLDTIKVKGVKAKFGYNGLPLCDGGIINFFDSSVINDVIANYAWQFGDGGISTLQNPSHFYSIPGSYNPVMVVTTNSGCSDTFTLPVPVRVVASPQAHFINILSGCTPVTGNLSGSLIVPDTSAIHWQWSLGNGVTSNLQNPPTQIYTIPQVYDITLIATNSTGCKDTVTKSFEVYEIPVITASGNVQICKGTPTQISASGGATYIWSPAQYLDCSNCASPMANPPGNAKYKVTGASIHGCINYDSLNITVIQPFLMNSKLDDTVCIGGSVRLFARGANSYVWSPTTGLSNPVSDMPLASPQTTTRYMVIGKDAYGCFADTGYANIKVYPKPVVKAGADFTMKSGAAPVVIRPVLSPDITWTNWLPSPGIVANAAPTLSVQPKVTTTYTIEARNDGGCKAADKITVNVLCDGANVFIPNTFSPNGDGANEKFYPRGAGLFRIKELRIFNRWGEVVFEKSNFNPNDERAGWDGTLNGKKMNSDVYVYTVEIICDNNTPLLLKGNIALLR